MDGIEIRPAIMEDFDQVTRLLRRSYAVLLAPDYNRKTLGAALPIISTAKPDLLASGRYFVALLDGQIKGAGGWADSLPGGRGQELGRGHIRHVAVDPSAARLGLGTALMAQIFASAQGAGVTQYSCFSTLTAERFYASCGFRTVAYKTLMLGGSVSFPFVEMEK